MRLDKFVANNSEFSRSQVRNLIKAGRLRVNGERPASAALHLTDADQVILDDEPLQAASDIYLMLHKPLGTVCANYDSEHPTVIDLIAQQEVLPNRRLSELQVVGRLDLDTSGLVLLTTDGDWNHRITAPNRECPKRYHVTCAHPISDEAINAMEAGLQLRNETRTTRPAQVLRLSATTAELTIYEGMYHQVKRMFAATGNKVIALHRLAIGDIVLDGSLKPGTARRLTEDEVAGFYR